MLGKLWARLCEGSGESGSRYLQNCFNLERVAFELFLLTRKGEGGSRDSQGNPYGGLRCSCTILLVPAFSCRRLMIPAYVLLALNCRSKEWKVLKGKLLMGVDSSSVAVTVPELAMKTEISLCKESGIFKMRLSFRTDFVAFSFTLYILLLWVWCMYHSAMSYTETPYWGNSLDLLNEVQPIQNITVQQHLSILWYKCIIVSSSGAMCFCPSPYSAPPHCSESGSMSYLPALFKLSLEDRS